MPLTSSMRNWHALIRMIMFVPMLRKVDEKSEKNHIRNSNLIIDKAWLLSLDLLKIPGADRRFFNELYNQNDELVTSMNPCKSSAKMVHPKTQLVFCEICSSRKCTLL